MITFKEYLNEMSKETLGSYIKKRSTDVANSSAADALEAGTNLKHSSKTVTGLDPITKEPIYAKEHPRFKENKKLQGIQRAVDRIIK